jgi:hypothetical protein
MLKTFVRTPKLQRATLGRFTSRTNSTKKQDEKSLKEKLRETVKVYGVTATIFHSTVYVASLSTVFLCVKNGLDAQGLLTSWGVDPALIPDGAGEIAAAWGITAVTGPARGLLTIAGTPLVAKVWGKKQNS